MKAKKYLLYAVLGAMTALALGATVLDAGVSRADNLEDVKLRQESARGGAGFFYAYRSHRGGGLRGGK